MKKTLIIFLVLFTIYAHTQVDTTVYKVWNSTVYANSLKTIEHYNGSCYSLGYNNYVWSGSTFTDKEQAVYTLDANNNITHRLYQKWQNATLSWQNDSDLTYHYYTSANKPDSVVKRVYNTNTANWKNSFKKIYTYNGNGLTSQELVMYWDSANSIWKNYLQLSFVYTSNNSLDSIYENYWDYGALAWQESFITSYTYTSNNQLDKITTLKYNNQTFQWDNFKRYNYYYYFSVTKLDIFETEVGVPTSQFSSGWKGYSRLHYYYNTIQTQAIDSTIENRYVYTGQPPSGYQWKEHQKTYFTNDSKARPIAEELYQAYYGIPDYYYENYSFTIKTYANCTPLAIKGLQFSVKSTTHNKVSLSWSYIGNNNNNNLYYVQKSVDGKNFNNISTLTASITQQSFIDEISNTTAATLYYRLALLHFDGTVEYTDIQTIKTNINQAAVDCYCKDNILYLNFNGTLSNRKNISLIVCNTAGQILIKEHLDLNSTSKQISTQKLSSGVYFTNIIIDGKVINKKFIKL